MFDILLSWPVVIGIAAALAAVAWFIPPLRRPALVGLALLAAVFAVRKSGERAGTERKQKEWDNAEEALRDRVEQASERARHTIDATPGGMRDSPYNRDNRDK